MLLGRNPLGSVPLGALVSEAPTTPTYPVRWTHTAPATLHGLAVLWWTHAADAGIGIETPVYWTHAAPAAAIQVLYWSHTAPAESLDREPVLWRHQTPALLLDSQIDIVTPAPVLTYPGGTCTPLAVTLTSAEDSPAWLADIQIDDIEVARAIPIGAALTLRVNSVDYALCCDGITVARAAAAPSLTIKASSPILQHGATWRAPVVLGTGLARSAVERLLGQAVDWDILDWRLPASVAGLEGAPLDLARAIVGAVRGRLESHPDGSLRARWQHPRDVPDYPTAPVSAALTDRQLFSARATLDAQAIFNRFLIAGQTGAESADAIQIESVVDPTDPTTYTLYAYPFPWRVVTLVHTGDAQTTLSAVTEQTLARRELIEIRAGVGSVAYPVATLREWTYQHDDLGQVRASGTAITTAKDGYSLVWVEYDTRAWVATATNAAGETIQFLAMEPL